MRTLQNSFSGATGKCGNPGVPFPPRGDGPVARPFLMKNLTKLLDLCGSGETLGVLMGGLSEGQV